MKHPCGCTETPGTITLCAEHQAAWDRNTEVWAESRRAVTGLHYGYDPWNEEPPNGDLI